MKILHVTPSYYPATYWGGPIFSVYALNNALAKFSWLSLKVVTTDSAGPDVSERVRFELLERSIYPRYEVLFTRRIAGKCISIGLLTKLPALVRWADVVHLTATYSFTTFPTLIICRILNKPVVWSHRGAILEVYEWDGAPRKRLKRMWEMVCNLMVRPGRTVSHVTSEREQEASQARIPNARPIIVPNGVDVPDSLPKREWLPNGKMRLMYLGRIAPKKGIENLLHAVRELNDPSVSLNIYGKGAESYEANVRRLADELMLSSGTVSFVGHVDGENKKQAFDAADVCVVPSFTENFCMVVAEALAHGVPVIASKGTPWQAVEEHGCGLWVENTPEALVHAINRIRMMQLEQMGRKGWLWMTSEYSWGAVADRMAEIYKKVTSKVEGLDVKH